MYLQEVDVGCLQPSERGFDGIEDRGTREPGLVHVVARVPQSRNACSVDPFLVMAKKVALGENEDFMTRDVVLYECYKDMSRGRYEEAAYLPALRISR